MRRFFVLVVLTAVLTPGFLHVPAARASAAQVLADCNARNSLTRQYPVADLRKALSTMSVDVKEYTDCYDLIQRALLTEIGGSHPGGTGGSQASSGGSFLPTPLIVVLVALVLGAAGFGVLAMRRRVNTSSPRRPPRRR